MMKNLHRELVSGPILHVPPQQETKWFRLNIHTFVPQGEEVLACRCVDSGFPVVTSEY